METLRKICLVSLVVAIVFIAAIAGTGLRMALDASHDVQVAQDGAGPAFACWAELNRETREGYEVLCRAK